MKKICARITRCSEDKPLVVIHSQPFNGLEARPDELRLLASSMEEMANLAEAQKKPGRGFKPTVYEASWETPPSAPPATSKQRR